MGADLDSGDALLLGVLSARVSNDRNPLRYCSAGRVRLRASNMVAVEILAPTTVVLVLDLLAMLFADRIFEGALNRRVAQHCGCGHGCVAGRVGSGSAGGPLCVSWASLAPAHQLESMFLVIDIDKKLLFARRPVLGAARVKGLLSVRLACPRRDLSRRAE